MCGAEFSRTFETNKLLLCNFGKDTSLNFRLRQRQSSRPPDAKATSDKPELLNSLNSSYSLNSL
jgi:hypothetical protein